MSSLLSKNITPTRREIRSLEEYVKDLYEFVDIQQKMKSLRTACYANFLINIQFEGGFQSSDVLNRILRESVRELKDSPKSPEIAIMYPILKI